METPQGNRTKEIQITAVVLNWKRSDNVRKIIRYLIKEPFITEVIIWNNFPKDFNPGFEHEKIKVINSKENLRDKAKYLAAAEAKNDYIFYQDDDWSVKHYLKAMYKAFCLNPDIIHIATGELTWALRKWETRKCINKDAGLQAEFSFICGGAMYKKSFAIEHLKYIEKYFNTVQSNFADVGFTLFTNQPYIEIQVSLSKTGLDAGSDVAFSSDLNFYTEVQDATAASRKALQDFSDKKRELPEVFVKSIFQNLLLFTNFYHHSIPKDAFLFDPTNAEHCRATTKEEIATLRATKPIREFRNNPYFSALAGTYQHIPAEKGWRTSLIKGNKFVLQSLIPLDLVLSIHFSNSEKDKTMLVEINSEKNHYSISQLNEMSFNLKDKVSFTAIEEINDIRLAFNNAPKVTN